MRVRHKTPTLVSMWMLDVFCCALGCVTLLWLLNTRQAGDQTAAAKSALTDLAAARADLKTARTVLEDTQLRLNSDIQQLTNQLAAVRTDKDEFARKLGIAQSEAKSAQALLDSTKVALNSAEARLDTTSKELAVAREKVDTDAEVLRKKQRDVDALAKKLTAAASTADEVALLLTAKEKERLVLERRADDLQKLLDDVTGKLATAAKDAEAAKDAAKDAAKLAAAKAAEELAAARGTTTNTQKKLDDTAALIVDLQGEKKKLADQLDKLQKDTENRFAGITMSGRRVVFMVDMSGSMEKTDEKTIAPHKWPTVAETVAKVMRTLPTLEKYQVVLFSKSARWVAGGGDWQPYEGEATAAAVKDMIVKVKPEGDTNLYSAFDLAFSLRAKGLDTIYLFSDGLPTSGPGLTPQQEASTALREQDKSEVLGRFLRAKLQTDWNRRLVGSDRVRIHAVGFFYESPDLGSFLWALARENDGSFVGMSKP